jgi:hypothetical protein
VKINRKYPALLLFFVIAFCKAQNPNVSTYSGTGIAGYQNGSNVSAEYNYPYGVAFDGNNSIYVADLYNNCIRKIDMLTNTVSTYAGTGVAGYQDGAAVTAKFNNPTGVYCRNGNVYVADNLNNRIRVIDGFGNVSTVAGNGVGGFANGSVTTASFYQPKSLYVASNGDVYVADYENHCIRKISGGQVTTYAGTGTAGYQNGSSSNAQFYRPRDITMDAQGNMFVTDLMNNVIRKITSSGTVSTFAGSGVAGSADGTGTLAQFNIPTGIDIDINGDFYVTDGVGNKVRKVSSTGVVTTIAGNGNTGYVDGSPLIAEFDLMQDLCLDANGNIYIGDRNNNCIRKIEISFCQNSNVSTYSGTGIAGYQNGTNVSSKYNYPYGVAFDGNNSIYVADLYNNCIRKIDMLTNTVSTYAGTGVVGYQDGPALTAKFNNPTGVYCRNGKVYVADNLNNRIRVIDGFGNVSTVAGNGLAGFVNGNVTAARFYQPKSLYVASNDDVYVSDYENHCIRKISGGQVTTYAGTGVAGYQNGSALTSQFYRPRDITMDAQGNMFITDLMNNVIRKITSAGVVSTFAGSGLAGGADGTGTLAEFNIPTGIDIDLNGDFYVTDAVGNKVRKITSAGVVTTIAGNGNTGYVDGSPLIAEFDLMQDLCLDANGNIYIGDRNNNCIRKIDICSLSHNVGTETLTGSNKDETNIFCFPNPAVNQITITGKFLHSLSSEVSLIDIQGKIILSKLFYKTETIILNVEELKSGFYFVSIKNEDNSVKNLKLVIDK